MLRFEFQRGGQWQPAVTITEDDQPGSLTHYEPDGRRQVIVFQCCGGWSTITRSTGGTDQEIGRMRVIHSLGSELLAKLLPGQQHERTIRLADGTSYQTRWTHASS